ncbi:MAG: S41 family peptidase [Lachnospiraceae bacterium]|nr:S41 family peptidase [Lachnospiraceae bacterium]
MNSGNKNSFLTGLAVGIVCALSAAMAAILIYLTGVKPETPSGENKPTLSPTSALQPTNGASANKDDVFTSISNEELLSKLREINGIIDKNSLYGATDEDKANAVIAGILNALNDKYAAYYTIDNMKAFQESTSGTYSGIGALVSQDPYSKEISIVRPFEGGPAYNSGLLKGDVFVKVAGIDVAGMDINEVVSYMKGPAGTDVEITVRRGEELITKTLTRATIEVPTVESEMLDNNIGYIQVTEFDGVTVSQFTNAITKLQKEGMEALVLDLRDNPGGLVDTAVSIADRIVPTGVVVYTEDNTGRRDYNYARTATELNIPVCVLINGNSASASEILCGALRDYNKATIVGTTSYGKGIVQVIQYLSDGSGLKYTISQYFTPSGYAVHGVGIVPDIEVELDEELQKLSEIPKDKDNQLQTAVKELLRQLGK